MPQKPTSPSRPAPSSHLSFRSALAKKKSSDHPKDNVIMQLRHQKNSKREVQSSRSEHFQDLRIIAPAGGEEIEFTPCTRVRMEVPISSSLTPDHLPQHQIDQPTQPESTSSKDEKLPHMLTDCPPVEAAAKRSEQVCLIQHLLLLN